MLKIGDQSWVKELHGKVAFVTGASEGMGRATALYLSSLGANVAMAARRIDALEVFSSEVATKYGTDPLPLKLDVVSEAEVESALAKSWARYGRLDYVVNFAGNPIGYARGDRKKPIHMQSVEHMKEIAEIDHFGSVRVLKHALPYMIGQRHGKIILISAITSVYGYSEDVDYIPYKRANEGLATSTALRSEREGWGVQLFTMAPGDVFNPSTWNAYDEKERKEAVGYGVVESSAVARVVAWLLSGRMVQRYEMKVDIDSGKVLDPGRFVPLKNGDVFVVDAKTLPKLFDSVEEPYTPFVPQGY